MAFDQPEGLPESYRQAARRGLQSHFSDQGEASIRVTSNSMAPLLMQGDRIVVRESGLDTLSPGAVILVEETEHWTTHRLLAITRQNLVTKGDRNFWPDIPMPLDAYMGTVTEIEWIRKGKVFRANLETPFWLALNRLVGLLSTLEYKIILRGCGVKWQAYHSYLIEARETPAWLRILASVPMLPVTWFIRVLVETSIRGAHWKK